MLSGSRQYQIWLKPTLSRLTLVDWLTLLLLLFAGYLATLISSAIGLEITSIGNLLPLFLCAAVVFGYCFRPATNKEQRSLASHFSIWPLVARSTALTILFIGLPQLILMFAVTASAEVVWIRTLSTLLVTVSLTVAGILLSRLPKRWGIPLLLLVLWWLALGGTQVTSTLASGLLSGSLIAQLNVLMVTVGILGAVVAVVELTANYQHFATTAHYIKSWSFERPMPSFTGMGSLLIACLLRLIRDKVILIYLGGFTVLLLSRVLMGGWILNWFLVVELGLVGLSFLVVSRLIKFSTIFSKLYAHLPIGPGQVDFVGYFAGIIVMTVVTWIILWGLFGVTGVVLARLLSAVLGGYSAIYLNGMFSRKMGHGGLFTPSWHTVGQLILFTLVFIYSIQLPLSSATLSLLALMFLVVITTCYQVTRGWATIKT
jgi:hypothetical protein